MAPGSWRPLLVGELATRAWDTVTAIAEALAILPVVDALEEGPWAGAKRASLAAGAPGPALLFGYLARSAVADSARYAELAGLYLDEAAETLATVPMRAGLFSGFTGVAWTSQHLDSLLGRAAEPDDPEADSNAEIDRAILETLAQTPWKGHFDLGTGLAGIGVYAVERLPRPRAVRCLAAVVGHLYETASVGEAGITWHTRPELLPAHRQEEEPLGIFNLGVAHGVPAVISLLADACRVEPCAERARFLLEGAVRWLLSVPRTGEAGSSFGAWVSPRAGVRPATRLAWCYGDPGIAATLLYAARTVGEARWEREALAIAMQAAQTPVEASGVVDPALCHGAVGLAHLYNRIYQATAEELFAEAARRWYRRALDMRRPGEGIAGFCPWGAVAGPATGWRGDPGLLTGAAGVGLGLLAAVSDRAPEWDLLLRVAIPLR